MNNSAAPGIVFIKTLMQGAVFCVKVRVRCLL